MDAIHILGYVIGAIIIMIAGYTFIKGNDEESYRIAMVLIPIGALIVLYTALSMIANYLYDILKILEKLPK